MEALGLLLAAVAFAAIYVLLRRRAGNPPVQWGWIAAVVAAALAAVLIGALTR